VGFGEMLALLEKQDLMDVGLIWGGDELIEGRGGASEMECIC